MFFSWRVPKVSEAPSSGNENVLTTGRPACYALFFIDVRVKENKNSMEEGKQAGNEPYPVARAKTRVPVNLHPPRRSATETADHGDF